MCDPVTIGLASAGLAIGGQMIQGKQQHDNQAAAINAQNDATRAEIARQDSYQKQSSAVLGDELQNYAPDKQADTLSNAQTAATNAVQQNTPTAAQFGSLTTDNAPKVIQNDSDTSIASRLGKAAGYAANAGNLSGYSGANSDLARGRKDAANQIGTIGGLSGVQAGLLPGAQAAAVQNAYKPPSPLGGLMSTLGGAGLNLAGSGNTAGLAGLFKNPFGAPGSLYGGVGASDLPRFA